MIEWIIGGVLVFTFYTFGGVALAKSITDENGPWGYDAHRWFRHTPKGRFATFLIGLLWPVVVGLFFIAMALALPLAILVGPYFIYRWIRYGDKI